MSKKLFRTRNGLIFRGEAELGEKLNYATDYSLSETDEVIAIGTTLFDLVQPGDLVQYHFKNKLASKHPMWLTEINDADYYSFTAHQSIVVDRIFIKASIALAKSPMFLESHIRPKSDLSGTIILGLY